MVQEWVFFGRCRDSYSEFMIQMNHDFIGRRGNESFFILQLKLLDLIINVIILVVIFVTATAAVVTLIITW